MTKKINRVSIGISLAVLGIIIMVIGIIGMISGLFLTPIKYYLICVFGWAVGVIGCLIL